MTAQKTSTGTKDAAPFFEYEIIASSSKGNCVIIGETMVDCGVPMAKIKKKLYKIKTLIITHDHSDHINKATYRAIRQQFPRIKVIGNYEVHMIHHVDIISNPGVEIKRGGITYLPFTAPHDVENHGYVWEVNGQRVIYTTDTWSMEHAPEGPYDWLFIESNHDETKVETIIGKTHKGYEAWKSSYRHLSTQKAKGFYYTHRRDNTSELVELHRSEQFY